MNKIMNKVTKIGFPLHIIIIVVIIIIGIIFLFTKNSNVTNTQTDITLQTANENINATALPVENQNQIKLSNKVISIKSPYFVNTLLQGSTASGITCGNGTNNACIIAIVSNGTEVYFVTSPYQSVAKDGIDRSLDTVKNIETSMGTISLKYTTLLAYNEEGLEVAEKNVVSQIYGCLNDICFNSGLLNIEDKTINDQQVAKFEDFLKSNISFEV